MKYRGRAFSFRISARTVFRFSLSLVVLITSLNLIVWGSEGFSFHANDKRLASMHLVTALCFLLAAASLALLHEGYAGRNKRILLHVLDAAIIALSLVVLLSHPALLGERDWSSGMMSVAACIMMICCGIVLSLLTIDSRKADNIAHALILPLFMAAYLIIVGYFYNIQIFREWRVLEVWPSLYTGIAFLVLSLAVLCTRSQTWLMNVFTGVEGGGRMARHFLPAIFIIPFLIGWLLLLGERSGAFELEIGMGLVAVLNTFCLFLLLWWTARSVNRTDRERRIAEEGLQRSKVFIDTVFHAISDSLSIIDVKNYTIVGINDAFCDSYRLAREAIVGRSCYEITHKSTVPCTPPDHICPLTQVLATGQPSIVEHVHQGPDGARIYFEISAYPVRDKDGIIRQIVHLGRDATERKRIVEENRLQREELGHVSRLATLGEFAASIAHEIQQPLTATMNNAQAALRFLSMEPPDIEEVRDILNDIVIDNKRAGDVIHNIRSLVKRKNAVTVIASVDALISDVLQLLHHEINARDVSVVRESNGAAVAVLGNKTELQQVLMNLILNACDAMLEKKPPERRLHIRTETDSGLVTVTVRDSGTGLKDDAIEHVFEPFYTTKPEGLGMGLSISKSIINTHGGRLWVENHPEGGAVFYFALPSCQKNHG